MAKSKKTEVKKTVTKRTASKQTSEKGKAAKSKVVPGREEPKAPVRMRRAAVGTAPGPDIKETSGEGRASAKAAADRMQELKLRLLEISDIGAAGSLLDWDQSTY